MGLFSDRQRDRARFYESMASALDAGLTAEQALGTLAGSGDATAEAVLPVVTRGEPLSRALESQGGDFSRFEVLSVGAGESSGRLPQVMQRLAGGFALRATRRDRLAYGLLYPVFLVHAAILLPPLFLLVRGGLGDYLGAVVPIFLFVYGSLALGWWLVRGLTASEAGRLRRDGLLLRVPGISMATRTTALAEYAHAFAILLGAGVPMPETLRQAADATRNRVFRAAGRRVCERVRAGDTLQQAMATERSVFGQSFVQAVAVGESAGKLEESLDEAAETARRDAERATLALAVAAGVVAYGLAALVVAWVVVRFFLGIATLPPGV